MFANAQAGYTKPSIAVGSLISVALMLGGSAAFAGEFSGFDASVVAAPTLMGMFTGDNFEQLEYATVEEGSSARVAAMMESVAPADQRGTARSTTSVARAANEDLFPHSTQLLPLLTVRADAGSAPLPGPASFRPGRVLPVGVRPSAIR